MKLHIGIIPDGNRRWARLHQLKPWEGHQHGYETLITLLKHLPEEVGRLTVYTLSMENLQRSRQELRFLYTLIERGLRELPHRLSEAGYEREDIHISFYGQHDLLPEGLRNTMQGIQAENPSQPRRLWLSLLIAYNGQDEILHAARTLIREGVKAEEVTRERFARALWLPAEHPVDIIIRTGMTDGQRLSGFMLWQSSYAEFYFLKKYWPDFTPEDLQEIITDFRENRVRRYGK